VVAHPLTQEEHVFSESIIETVVPLHILADRRECEGIDTSHDDHRYHHKDPLLCACYVDISISDSDHRSECPIETVYVLLHFTQVDQAIPCNPREILVLLFHISI
jgi:hypothetical protein